MKTSITQQLSEAMSSYAAKQANGATWIVGKPGCIPVYEVTDEMDARALARSCGKGYVAAIAKAKGEA